VLAGIKGEIAAQHAGKSGLQGISATAKPKYAASRFLLYRIDPGRRWPFKKTGHVDKVYLIGRQGILRR